MASIGTTLADAAAMGPRYARRLVDNVPAERFARLAAPAGEVIHANHPAFILGHLCLYPAKVVQLLGGDTTQLQPPTGFEELFSKDATCQDDVDGRLYPPRDQILSFFEYSYAAALDAVRAASDEQFNAPNPIASPVQSILPTLGGLIGFYLTGHVMMHLGQLSTWRRMQALPPA